MLLWNITSDDGRGSPDVKPSNRKKKTTSYLICFFFFLILNHDSFYLLAQQSEQFYILCICIDEVHVRPFRQHSDVTGYFPQTRLSINNSINYIQAWWHRSSIMCDRGTRKPVKARPIQSYAYLTCANVRPKRQTRVPARISTENSAYAIAAKMTFCRQHRNALSWCATYSNAPKTMTACSSELTPLLPANTR